MTITDEDLRAMRDRCTKPYHDTFCRPCEEGRACAVTRSAHAAVNADLRRCLDEIASLRVDLALVVEASRKHVKAIAKIDAHLWPGGKPCPPEEHHNSACACDLALAELLGVLIALDAKT